MVEEVLGEDFDRMKIHGLVRTAGTTKYSWRDHSNLSLGNIQRVMDILAQTE